MTPEAQESVALRMLPDVVVTLGEPSSSTRQRGWPDVGKLLRTPLRPAGLTWLEANLVHAGLETLAVALVTTHGAGYRSFIDRMVSSTQGRSRWAISLRHRVPRITTCQ